MKRHLRWIVPIVAIPIVFLGAAAAMNMLAAQTQQRTASAFVAFFAYPVVALAALAALISAVVLAIGGAKRTYGDARRRRGKFTTTESAAIAASQQREEAWRHAQGLRLRLIRKELPHAIQTWSVVPNQNEVFFYEIPAHYARFYGQDVTYTQTTGFYLGHPAFVAAGLATQLIGNAARRSAAQAQAAAQWREQQPTTLIVSNQRLICNVRGEWLSFYYSGMTAIFPEVGSWTLIAQFESTSPLMLHGQLVPAAAIITTLMTHGPAALEAHPSLRALGTVADGEVSPQP